MKLQWSALFTLSTLLFLASCGSEQFGSVPRSTTSNPDSLTSYASKSCSQSTLVKPKVDVVYLVDNSGSANVIADGAKSAIQSTVNSLSSDFDYRVIVTPLLETATGNSDYQVMTNSSDLAGIPSDQRRVYSSSQFNFFKTPQPGLEKGLQRSVSFLNSHRSSLLRNGSHLIVVLLSNGRDQEVEEDTGSGNVQDTTVYNSRLASLRALKNSPYSHNLRFFSVTAKTHLCQPGYWSANLSYAAMAKQIYAESGASDNSALMDSYDLCGDGLSTLFSGINSSIKQEVLKHQYRYWPITFAENNENVSISQLKVVKVDPNGNQSELAKNTVWVYEDKGSSVSVNTRELPTVGEPVVGRHFVRFTDGNLITFPDCVLISSVSKTEYFGYFVIPQKPVESTISVRVNGMTIPNSAWTLMKDSSGIPVQLTQNIKVNNPTATPPGEANPPIIKTGFMLKINSPSNYYKSGDNVEVSYQAAAI